MSKLFHASVCAALLLFTATANASSFGDALKDRATDSITPKTSRLGLGQDADAKEKLLDKAGLKQTQKDPGYEQGLAGVLMDKGDGC